MLLDRCTSGERWPAHGDENVCFRQIPAVRGLLNGLDSNCIKQHRLFAPHSLDGELIEINRR